MNATRLSRPIGRRAGRSTTRASILEAALEQFSQRGFNGTSIRRIAAAADVDASLVTHYFGTKDALLRACIEEVGAGPAPFLLSLEDRSPGVGTRVALAYLGMWEQPVSGRILRAIARATTDSPTAAAILSRALGDAAIARSSSPETVARLQLALSQLLGVAFARYVFQVRPLADLPLEQVATLVGSPLDALLVDR